MKELGEILEKVLREKKLWHRYKQYRVVEQWEAVVGEEIGRVSKAHRLHQGRLWVTVKDSTWAYHLSLLQPQLLEKLNQQAAGKIVKEIYFTVGPVEKLEEKEKGRRPNNRVKEGEIEENSFNDDSFIERLRCLKQQIKP